DVDVLPVVAGFGPGEATVVVGVEADEGGEAESIDAEVVPVGVGEKVLAGGGLGLGGGVVAVLDVEGYRAGAQEGPLSLIGGSGVLLVFEREGKFIGRGVSEACAQAGVEGSVTGDGRTVGAEGSVTAG